jgi:hypothetical protein
LSQRMGASKTRVSPQYRGMDAILAMGLMPLWSKGSWAPLELSYDSPLYFMSS